MSRVDVRALKAPTPAEKPKAYQRSGNASLSSSGGDDI